MEKAVHKHLIKYLELLNFFHHSHHGFLRGRCKTTAIIQLVNKILEWETKIMFLECILTIRRPFECIDWKTLVAMLEELEMEEVALIWIIIIISRTGPR